MDGFIQHLRFVPGMKGVTPILRTSPKPKEVKGTAPAIAPAAKPDPAGTGDIVCWAYQRDDGGRAFVFTGGHGHENWGIPAMRRLVVNGILWTAHVEVPPGGAPVELDPADLKANLAPKPKAAAKPATKPSTKPVAKPAARATTKPSAASRPAAAADRREGVDWASVGRLPARFNGRLTTWDGVARNYLKRISGREVYYDDEGREQPAIRWLMEMCAEPEDAWGSKILLVDNTKLRLLLDLPARDRPDPQRMRYGLGELPRRL